MADEGPPELYDEALLLEAEKFTEATACADEQRLNSSSEPVVSSFSSSHWSSSWSKPPRNTLEPQLPLLPEDNSSDKAAMKPAEVTVELSPCSSLSKNSDRVITVRFSTLFPVLIVFYFLIFQIMPACLPLFVKQFSFGMFSGIFSGIWA